MCRRATLAGLLLLLGSPAAAAEPTTLDDIAAALSPELAGAERRLARLSGLAPQHRPAPARCLTLGYCSRVAPSPLQIRWVQVDLGVSSLLDYVVLVPTVCPGGDREDGASWPGCCFPPRLHVQLSDDPDFAASTTIAEVAAEGAAATRPVVVPTPHAKARYIRVTATRLAGRDGRYFFTLGELLALSGNLNLAAGREVSATDSIEDPPLWGKKYLVDGQGMVGPPLSPLRSPSNGYHAAISASPQAEKWVQVDLGEECRLDEVRLVPARPSDHPGPSGFGFPKRFKVEADTGPGFNSPRLLLDATGSDYPNPGDGLVVIPARGVTARYIRVTASLLWERTGEYVFALAELQAYALARNVARGKEVAALDSIDGGMWSKHALVDGFASHYELAEWPQWAAAEQEWTEWMLDRREAEAAVEAARAGAYSRLVWILSGLAAGGVLLAAGRVWRARVSRRREAAVHRQRMVRDLHDELCSNLGGIQALAEAGNAADMPEIARLVGRTATALRDLVWLMSGEVETQVDLVAKLRETAEVQLPGIQYSFEAPVSGDTTRISPDFKLNVFLAFKEMLANVVRHAGGGRVAIHLYRDGRWLILEVKDGGKGFNPNLPSAGSGLQNLRVRAAALHGELEVHSSPGCGTLIRLIARV